jgi:hypothetical protein
MDTTNLPQVVIWKFDGKPGNLRAQNHYSPDSGGDGYSMFCQSNGEYLTYKEVPLGINVQFTSDAGLHKTHFKLPDGAEREILTGESVALGIGGGDAFLCYAHRTSGINLKWAAEDPGFQWRLYDLTGEKGKPIATNSFVAIGNVNVEPKPDYLVYLDRLQAGDIGWTSSPDWKGTITDAATAAAHQKLLEILAS